jgi:hypothetical protein
MKTDSTQLENTSRPDNSWIVIYGEGQTELIEAQSFNEAKETFLDTHPDADIHSVSWKSYVKAEWIGNAGVE